MSDRNGLFVPLSCLAFAGLVLVGDGAPPADAAPRAGLAWRVADQAFVNYAIHVEKRTDSKLDGYARWGEVDDVAGFHGYELDDDRTVERELAYEPMLYVPFVFRLPKQSTAKARTKIDEEIPWNFRLDGFRAKGHVTTVGAIGKAPNRLFEVQGDVTFRPPRKPDEMAGPRRALRRLTAGGVSWTATFDEKRGLLTDVRYRLRVDTHRTTVRRPRGVSDVDAYPRSYDATIRLELDRVFAHRYDGFQKDVDRAIDRGIAYLMSELRPDGTIRASRALGETALALLALCDGGADTADPRIRKGVEWLVRQPPRKTYDVGVTLLALDAYRTPAAEREMRRRGELKRALPRNLNAVEAKWRDDAVAFLLETARTRPRRGGEVTGSGGVLRWGYPRENWPAEAIRPDGYWDNSNTQYGVLGLDAAARLGAKIPRRVWEAVAGHWLSTQQGKGKPMPDFTIATEPPPSLRRPGARSTHGPGAGSSSRYAPVRRPAEARGWSYSRSLALEEPHPRTGEEHGAMTAGGVGSLAIARARLADHGAAGKRMAEIDVGIRDGLACMADRFHVWRHADYDGWYSYSLYSMERAGVLANVRSIGGHDWYWEGALQLLLRQKQLGDSWSYDLGRTGTTCWAILFLKRATTTLKPAITPSSGSRRRDAR